MKHRCKTALPRPRGPFSLPLLLLLLLSACAQGAAPPDGQGSPASAQFRGGASHTGAYDGGDFRALRRVEWSACTGGAVRGSVAVVGDAAYVAGGDGWLRALDLATGETRWRAELGVPSASSPAVAAGIVVATARDGRVHAVRASDGGEVWTLNEGPELPLPWGREGWDYFTASPAVANGQVVLAGRDGVLRRVRLSDGEILRTTDLGARLRSSPALAQGRAFVGGADGVVYAIDLTTDSVVWRSPTEGASLNSAAFGFDRRTVQASPAVVDGRVYVGGRDGRLYALDAATGERVWVADYAPSWVVSSPAVGGGAVYTGTSDAHVVEALDADTGARRWRVDMGTRVLGSPSLAGDVLLVPGNDGVLTALDAVSGETLWRYTAGDMIQSSPVVAGDLVLFGDDAGIVHALRAGEPSPGAASAPASGTPHLAVFYDSALAGFAATPGAARLADDLARAGYERLDAAALERYLTGRLRDHAPGVVVFALDHVPSAVAPTGDSAGLLRRWLDAGGKVVWTGIPPLALVRDSTGRPRAFEPARAAALTGIDLATAGASDYAATPTPAGKAWGLARVHLAAFSPDSVGEATVLARNELGRPAAFVRSFGGAEGTGFVYLWGRGYRPDMVAEIRHVAERGVLTRPGATRLLGGCPAR